MSPSWACQSQCPYPPKTPTPQLLRSLGSWEAASIVVGTIIGSGIFLVPSTMASEVGSAPMVLLVFAVGGLLSLGGALTYAELSAAMPYAGGEYVYLREAYGPLWSFLYGWTQFWVAKSGGIAALGTAFFLYLANFAPGLETPFFVIPLPLGEGGAPLEVQYGQILAIGVILGLAWLNYFGVKLGARGSNRRHRAQNRVDPYHCRPHGDTRRRQGCQSCVDCGAHGRSAGLFCGACSRSVGL